MEKRSRHQLCLQEDTVPGQYQIRGLGTAATVSGVSFDNWRPIDWLSRNLTDTDHLDLIANKKLMPENNSPPPRNGIARLGAWVKRSGKGLVIRLRKNGNKMTTDYTDIHLMIGDRDVAELDDTSILELPCLGTPIELCGTSWHNTDELPGSGVSTELPTIHNLLEMEAPAISSRSDISGMASPTGTARSTLSTADTVVASEKQESEDLFATETSQPIVKGLTIAGSVRYRCGSHPHFEPSSPVEIVRLVRDAAEKGLNNGQQQLLPGKSAQEQDHQLQNSKASSDQYDDWKPLLLAGQRFAGETVTPKADAKQLDAVRHPPPEMAIYPVRVEFEMIASRTVYQQDLHISRALTRTHTFTTKLCGMLDPIADKLKNIDTGLPASGIRDIQAPAEEAAKQVNVTASSATAIPHPKGDATVPPQTGERAEIEVEETPPPILANEHSPAASDTLPSLFGLSNLPMTPKMSSTSPTPSCSCGETAKGVEVPSKQDLSQQHIAASPVSPLTTKEALRRYNSIASQCVPITPMTPVQPHGAVNVAGDRRGVTRAHSDSNIDSIIGSPPGDDSFAPVSPEKPVSEITEALSESPRAPQGLEILQNNTNPSAMGEVGVKFFADFVDHQRPSTPIRTQSDPLLGYSADDKIPARYRNTRFKGLSQINTDVDNGLLPRASPDESSWSETTSDCSLPQTRRAEPRHASVWQDTSSLLVSSLVEIMQRSSSWLQRHAGKEPPIPEGHVRVRWTCDCGEQLFDDFVELRAGAARRLEAALNKETPHPYQTPRSGSRGSQNSLRYTPSSSKPSSSGSRSSASAGFGPPSGYPYPTTPTRTASSSAIQMFPMQPPRFLMTCVYESRNTPKLTQIPLHSKHVQTDSELASAFRDHYASVNRKWYRTLRLRGLTSIEFIQFYVHRNRFADIRKCPDVPPTTVDYDFTHSDVLPPMSGQYLLHLFKHPHEYDPEIFAYLYIPKKVDRLEHGIGKSSLPNLANGSP